MMQRPKTMGRPHCTNPLVKVILRSNDSIALDSFNFIVVYIFVLNLVSASVLFLQYNNKTFPVVMSKCRTTVRLACLMDLINYPMDEQKCPIYISSCKFNYFNSNAIV